MAIKTKTIANIKEAPRVDIKEEIKNSRKDKTIKFLIVFFIIIYTPVLMYFFRYKAPVVQTPKYDNARVYALNQLNLLQIDKTSILYNSISIEADDPKDSPQSYVFAYVLSKNDNLYKVYLTIPKQSPFKLLYAPAIVPYKIVTTSNQNPDNAVLIGNSIASPNSDLINKWATAYYGTDNELTSYVQDPTAGAKYTALNESIVKTETRIINCIQTTNEYDGICRISVSVYLNGISYSSTITATQTTYDVYVKDISTAQPRVIAWGFPYQQISPYMNATYEDIVNLNDTGEDDEWITKIKK